MAPSLDIVVSALIGVGAGLLSGFLGIGGGALITPMLVFVLGFDQHRAQGISLAALLPPVGLPAVITYRRSGVRIVFALVVALVIGFVLGAPAGAWSAHRVPAQGLKWAFAVFLLLAAVNAVQSAPQNEGDVPVTALPLPRIWLGVPIGFAAGTLSGLLGVGGAIIALPLLRRFVGLGRLEAQATTLAMMLPPIGLPAVLVYAHEQRGLPWELLAAVALGFALGADGGARLASRVNARASTLVYAAFLGITAIALVSRG